MAGAERDVGADVAQRVGAGLGLAVLQGDVTRRRRNELHQSVRVGG